MLIPHADPAFPSPVILQELLVCSFGYFQLGYSVENFNAKSLRPLEVQFVHVYTKKPQTLGHWVFHLLIQRLDGLKLPLGSIPHGND